MANQLDELTPDGLLWKFLEFGILALFRFCERNVKLESIVFLAKQAKFLKGIAVWEGLFPEASKNCLEHPIRFFDDSKETFQKLFGLLYTH